jgi:hypothetical protein
MILLLIILLVVVPWLWSKLQETRYQLTVAQAKNAAYERAFDGLGYELDGEES